MDTPLPFEGTIYNEANLTPTSDFLEAYTLISSGKTWKKWSKIISQKAYRRLEEDARASIESFGLENPEKALKDFMTGTIDFYLEHGTLKPGYMQYFWELALFAMFRTDIDTAINRRVKAIRSAKLRRQRKAEATISQSNDNKRIEVKVENVNLNSPDNILKNGKYHAMDGRGILHPLRHNIMLQSKAPTHNLAAY